MKNIKLLICVMFIAVMMFSSSCFAAWWGTPGYEWALSKNLTSIKTQSQLNKDVTASDYYNIILNYLYMKNVKPKGVMVQNLYTDGIYNGALNGLVNDINSRIDTNITSISPQQYRIVEDLVLHGKEMLVEYAAYLYRDDLKDLTLYLDLARYRAATLLSEDSKIERQYKNDILWKLRNTKYAVSLRYGIMPMCGSDISRQSFLVLMYNLLSSNTTTSASIIESFYETTVLRGFDDGLWLKRNLTYAQMFAFLYRFEFYDFE